MAYWHFLFLTEGEGEGESENKSRNFWLKFSSILDTLAAFDNWVLSWDIKIVQWAHLGDYFIGCPLISSMPLWILVANMCPLYLIVQWQQIYVAKLQESKPNFFPQNIVNEGGWGWQVFGSKEKKKKKFLEMHGPVSKYRFYLIQIQTNKIKSVASWSNWNILLGIRCYCGYA